MKHIPKKYIPLIVATFASIVALLFHLLGVSSYFLSLANKDIPLPKGINHLSDYYNNKVYAEQEWHDSDNIKIFDITECERKDFIEILSVLNQMHPKVIGIDVQFRRKTNDSIDDKLLAVLKEIDNLVLPVKINTATKDTSYGYFHDSLSNKTHAMVALDIKDVLRSFDIYTKDSILFFSYAVAYLYDSTICKTPNNMIINYTTLKLDPDGIPDAKKLLDSDSASYMKEVKDKIVLLGEARSSSSDKIFTPCGEMYGILCHAHIVDMLLNRKHIIELPIWMRFVLALILSVLYSYYLFTSKVRLFNKNENVVCEVINRILKFLFFAFWFVLSYIIGRLLYKNYCYCCDFTIYVVAFINVNLSMKYLKLTNK